MILDILLYCFCFIFEIGTVTLEFVSFRLVWLASEVIGPSCLRLFMPGLQAVNIMSGSFYECWVCKLRSSCLARKHFTD